MMRRVGGVDVVRDPVQSALLNDYPYRKLTEAVDRQNRFGVEPAALPTTSVSDTARLVGRSTLYQVRCVGHSHFL